MTIHLPPPLESSILEAVHSGRYASLDDAMAEAASLLLQRLKQEKQTENAPSDASTQAATVKRHQKPIWEVADELRKSVLSEEWANLPVDGATQHDHYIYGTPKRPTS
jgi:Arc/MetJ-type ribon-helix-helix transcriptional regulator